MVASVYKCAILVLCFSITSPFLTQRSKSKFVVARPAKFTETLLKYILMEEILTQHGGFKHENDVEFAAAGGIVLKPGPAETIEIAAPEFAENDFYHVGATIIWDMVVLGWEVSYKEEFIPTDEGSYTIIIHKEKQMDATKELVHDSFSNNEPNRAVLTIVNHTKKKKRAFYH
ncbi:hypothetical protein Cgig2_006609 [Carnegiea gigantea]|uniref:Patellin-1-6 C-terminal GOLD domain-containing protein n=1 Tax=Carnegiea gigantea TaxID=171969 RepID=A0A9Q1KM16_9CARY|nr:hypothetical protein Cgig2_006609 [Carnegiea gigantea]